MARRQLLIPNVHPEHQLAVVLACGAANAGRSSLLRSRPSAAEGVYLYRHGVDPYSGGVFYHSPLYLLAFTYLVDVNSSIFTAILWTVTDVISALLLVQIWRSRGLFKLKPWRQRDHIVALLFLFNPYSLLSCLARSTTSIDNAFGLAAIAAAFSGNAVASMAALALAVQTSLYPIILLLPLLLVIGQTRTSTSWNFLVDIAVFAGVLSCSVAVCIKMLGNTWMMRTWGVMLMVTDLTPNVGMWWYFFTEMFDHFRALFRGVFQLHLLIYVVPLCLRLPDPRDAVLILVGTIATWKSYPTLGDMSLWAGLLACYPDYTRLVQHPLFSLTVHLYTAILLPLLHSLWLLIGAGNANFFYAATMVYGLNSTLAIADLLGAMLSSSVRTKVRGFMPLSKAASDGDAVDLPPGWTVAQLATLD